MHIIWMIIVGLIAGALAAERSTLVDQAALTGESYPAEKSAGISDPKEVSF